MVCAIQYTNEQGEIAYTSNATFINYGETCSASIVVNAELGAKIENLTTGCMLNAGSVALPFSEYTDIAVVKDN